MTNQLSFNPIDQFLIFGPCVYDTNIILYNRYIIIPGIVLSLLLCSSYRYLSMFSNFYTTLHTITSSAIWSTQGYTSFLVYLLINVFILNLIGMIPFTLALTSFTFVTLYFSYIAFIGLNTISLSLHNERFVNIFLPTGTPLLMSWFLILLEFTSYFVRILSLAIRLFANVLAGHALIKILSSFVWLASLIKLFGLLFCLIPWSVLFIIMFLELLICILQAYVFITLVSLYINDILNMH